MAIKQNWSPSIPLPLYWSSFHLAPREGRSQSVEPRSVATVKEIHPRLKSNISPAAIEWLIIMLLELMLFVCGKETIGLALGRKTISFNSLSDFYSS